MAHARTYGHACPSGKRSVVPAVHAQSRHSERHRAPGRRASALCRQRSAADCSIELHAGNDCTTRRSGQRSRARPSHRSGCNDRWSATGMARRHDTGRCNTERRTSGRARCGRRRIRIHQGVRAAGSRDLHRHLRRSQETEHEGDRPSAPGRQRSHSEILRARPRHDRPRRGVRSARKSTVSRSHRSIRTVGERQRDLADLYFDRRRSNPRDDDAP